MKVIYIFLVLVCLLVVELYGQPGTIRTVVGGGDDVRYSGDGGPATDARMGTPWDVVVDAKGNVYIADENNHRVRVVTPDGIIRTYAGNGNGFQGPIGDGGPASLAGIQHPLELSVDLEGSLYISDHLRRVRKVDSEGIILGTSAGHGQCGRACTQ